MLHYNQVLSLTGTILGVLIDATFDWMLHSNSNRMKTNATVATVSGQGNTIKACLLYTSPSPRDATLSRMPSSA